MAKQSIELAQVYKMLLIIGLVVSALWFYDNRTQEKIKERVKIEVILYFYDGTGNKFIKTDTVFIGRDFNQ